MGTTAEKLTYLNETKTKLKDMLNLGGASLTTEPFRQYVDTLKNRYLYFINNGTQEVWDNWEKVVGEGTTITLNNTEEAPMKIVLKGNTLQNGTPTPETPQDIHVVSGDNSIEVKGKNLFDGTPFVSCNSGQGYINKLNGQATIISSDNNNVTFKVDYAYGGLESNYIPVKANETYTLNLEGTNIGNRFFITQYDNSKTRISTLNNVSIFSFPLTFTTTNNGYITIANTNTSVPSSNCILKNIQLEKGSNATTYEAYKGASYPINLGNIELCKIGDYQDYIYKDNKKWYKYGAIGKVVLNGSDTGIQAISSYDEVTALSGSYQASFSQILTKKVAEKIVLSNYFEKDLLSSRNTKTNIIYTYVNDGIVRIANNISTTKAGFLTWLSTHNTLVYYVLATPTTTEITDSTLLSQLNALAKSYTGQTNISQESNDLASLLNATALEEMS